MHYIIIDDIKYIKGCFIKYDYLNKDVNNDTLNKVKKEFKSQVRQLLKTDLKYCIFNNKKTVKNSLNLTFNHLINKVKTINDLINLFNFNKNNKVNKNIKSINYKPYLLCNNMINNTCNLCDICYSSKQELAYKYKNRFKNYYSLLNSLSNFILFYYAIFNKSNNIIFKGILRQLKYNTMYFKNNVFDVLRFNIKSDIDNINILLLFNDIHKLFMRLFKNNNFISYTYSKSLFLKNYNFNDIHKNFIINKSYGLINDNKTLKKVIKKDLYNKGYLTLRTDYKYDSQLLKKLNKCNYLNNKSNKILFKCNNCHNSCHNKNSIRLNYTFLH